MRQTLARLVLARGVTTRHAESQRFAYRDDRINQLPSVSLGYPIDSG